MDFKGGMNKIMEFRIWLENTGALDQLVDSLKKEFPQLEDLYAWETDSRIEISAIKVYPDVQGKGVGSEVLNRFKKYAASVGKPIVLAPEAEPRKKAALQRFYKNAGFVNNKGRYQDYSLAKAFASSMYWRPDWD